MAPRDISQVLREPKSDLLAALGSRWQLWITIVPPTFSRTHSRLKMPEFQFDNGGENLTVQGKRCIYDKPTIVIKVSMEMDNKRNKVDRYQETNRRETSSWS